MTSAENRRFGAFKFEKFLREDTPRPPYKALAFGTRDNAPCYERPTYGPDKLTSRFNFMKPIGIYGYIFYGLTPMLTCKNVNNDVTMNLHQAD